MFPHLIIISCLLQAIASAAALPITQFEGNRLTEQPIPFLTEIPGGSPLYHCNDSHSTNDLYQIDSIELHPKPLHM